MEHYFIDKEHSISDYFVFRARVGEYEFEINSCDSVFSKDQVDYGTNLLIKTIIKNDLISGKVLDVGCGYGIICMALAKHFPQSTFYACDINATAVKLTQKNVQLNNIKNVVSVVESNAYNNIVEYFDVIVSNPPIKAGKDNLLKILCGAHEHLNQGGQLVFVIKKKHGEDSVKRELEKVFDTVEVLKRDKGYYILRAIK